MNQIDVFIIIVAGIPTIFGLTSGLLKNLLAFTGIATGLYVAIKFNSQILSYLSQFSWYSTVMNLVSFFTVVLIFYFAGILIARKISGINFITKTIDRIAGTIFGLLQGLLIASMILLFINTLDFIPHEIKRNSLLYDDVIEFAPDAFNVISELFPVTKSYINEIEFLNDSIP
ncbi:MAG: colicin V production protein [Chlorobi bacterium OLB4]|jgi:Colicin V production protein.|nr:MAG: colicin V production protein [Chlorobi bacterium OLB4]MBW7856525.1 CvpA family protein [Ignavibacteria bacterium]OQY77684.1 MAG: hypothetical protein B6D43_04040 [Ignavibacteriales bacterium UTCHB1]